jgi:hypothetical protein
MISLGEPPLEPAAAGNTAHLEHCDPPVQLPYTGLSLRCISSEIRWIEGMIGCGALNSGLNRFAPC